MTLTAYQVELLTNITFSDYASDWSPVGIPVWSWDVTETFAKASAGGIVSGAAKAGLVYADGDTTIMLTNNGDNSDYSEACITMLDAGWDALLAHHGITRDDSDDGEANYRALEAALKADSDVAPVVAPELTGTAALIAEAMATIQTWTMKGLAVHLGKPVQTIRAVMLYGKHADAFKASGNKQGNSKLWMRA